MKLPFELQANETVLQLCRRHWVYLYPRLVLLGLVAVIPIVLLTWIVAAGPGLDGIAGFIVVAVDLVWAIYWLGRLYFTWFRYNNDVWVITNQRIVDSLRKHWFHHRMASADLVDVEDIAVTREGLLSTVFNYGDLRCQTAGALPNFVLSGIPDPSGVLGVVDAARDSARQGLVQAAPWRA